jgi:Tol biopolymer transport system component
VTVVDTDAHERLWRTPPAPDAVGLAWTEAGELAAIGRTDLRVFDADGQQVRRLRLGAGTTGEALAARPGADEIAFTAFSEASGTGGVWLYERRSGRARLVFSGSGRFRDVTWSPDGRLLLVGWAAADQWLFIPLRSKARVLAVASAAATFSPSGAGSATFPRIEGWCCPKTFR